MKNSLYGNQVALEMAKILESDEHKKLFKKASSKQECECKCEGKKDCKCDCKDCCPKKEASVQEGQIFETSEQKLFREASEILANASSKFDEIGFFASANKALEALKVIAAELEDSNNGPARDLLLDSPAVGVDFTDLSEKEIKPLEETILELEADPEYNILDAILQDKTTLRELNQSKNDKMLNDYLEYDFDDEESDGPVSGRRPIDELEVLNASIEDFFKKEADDKIIDLKTRDLSPVSVQKTEPALSLLPRHPVPRKPKWLAELQKDEFADQTDYYLGLPTRHVDPEVENLLRYEAEFDRQDELDRLSEPKRKRFPGEMGDIDFAIDSDSDSDLDESYEQCGVCGYDHEYDMPYARAEIESKHLENDEELPENDLESLLSELEETNWDSSDTEDEDLSFLG